jgi:hypothetical protein
VKFDALVFESYGSGLKPELALTEIHQAIPESALSIPLEYATEKARRASPGMSAARTDVDSMMNRIGTCLANRACHAMDWYGHTVVLARAGQFRDFLCTIRGSQAQHFLTEYLDADTSSSPFLQARFADYGGEADVCWQLARGNAPAVLVLCEFASHGDWWRPVTARAEPVAAALKRGYKDHYDARVVYRVDSAEVLWNLWSRTSYDDGIAFLCAPETADPQRLMGDFVPGCHSDRAMVLFAQECGWVYAQRYGGGADEHFAQFSAKDPDLVARVYDYAQDRALRDSGWWLAGMI